MAHVLDSTRSFLYANPELELPNKRSEAFKRLVRKRTHGQPIAYLTGKSEFWSLPLSISPAVLIPRPETELLVETALDKIPGHADWRIADLGTGSGAISLALATERQKCEIHATDISPAALLVAQENAAHLNIRNVYFHQGSWNRPLRGQFHLIASNPPYVDADDPHLSQGDCRFEPRKALTPGMDGLRAIRKICELSEPILVEGGWLMIEHGWDQGPAVRKMMQSRGFTDVVSRKDLLGHERVTLGEKS